MRHAPVILSTVLSFVVVSTSQAQCNRGGRSSTGSFARTPTTTTGLTSPLAAFNPIGTGPSASFVALAQYRSQLARQQYLLTQQQRYRQAMAQRQRSLQSQLAARRAEVSSAQSRGDEVTPTNARKERLRAQNAEKAFKLAEKAELSERLSTAERHYRRVVQILGMGAVLSQQASEALDDLAQQRQQEKQTVTLLTSLRQ